MVRLALIGSSQHNQRIPRWCTEGNLKNQRPAVDTLKPVQPFGQTHFVPSENPALFDMRCKGTDRAIEYERTHEFTAVESDMELFRGGVVAE